MNVMERIRLMKERIDNKIHSLSARIQTKVNTQRVDVVVPPQITGGGSELSSMQSSWVRNFTYDNHNQVLYMTTKKGRTYTWQNVPVDIAWECIRGNATCTTDDLKKRWWVGKSPSLGAAYWTYLHNKSFTKTTERSRTQRKLDQGAQPMFNPWMFATYNAAQLPVLQMATTAGTAWNYTQSQIMDSTMGNAYTTKVYDSRWIALKRASQLRHETAARMRSFKGR
jgi:hypothetical protein